MEKYSIREVLEQAVQTERMGNEFYIEMAKRFEKDDKLRKLFETLAIKEKEHEKTFTDLKEKVNDRRVENWEEVSQYMRAIVESEFFLGREKALPSFETINNIDDAVRYAISFEKETLLYYHGIRDLIREKDIVKKLIEEEKSHIIWLNDFRNTINK